MTLVVTPSPGVASDQDTDLFILATINGVAQPEQDANAGPVSYPVNVGDTGTLQQQDKNVVGLSALSPTVSFGPIAEPVPTAVPQTPGAPTFTVTDP